MVNSRNLKQENKLRESIKGSFFTLKVGGEVIWGQEVKKIQSG